jgi:hypothetical protein
MGSHLNSSLRKMFRLYLLYLRTILWASPWAVAYAVLRTTNWDHPILLMLIIIGGTATSFLVWGRLNKEIQSTRFESVKHIEPVFSSVSPIGVLDTNVVISANYSWTLQSVVAEAPSGYVFIGPDAEEHAGVGLANNMRLTGTVTSSGNLAIGNLTTSSNSMIMTGSFCH